MILRVPFSSGHSRALSAELSAVTTLGLRTPELPDPPDFGGGFEPCFSIPPGQRNAADTAERRTAAGCTHGAAGRGDELPVPRDEVGLVGLRRGRGAAAGERAGPSGARTNPAAGEAARRPHRQHGHLQVRRRGSAGGRPRAARGAARPGPAPPVPAVHGGGRAPVPPGLRALHGCGGVPAPFPGAGPLVTSPARAGSAACAPHGRRGPRGCPRRCASRPARWRGGPQRSVLPGCACPVTPFRFARFPRGFGKMASPSPP